MMDARNSDSLAIEAGQTGVKLVAEGGGAARLSHALADILSPLSNALGFVGDQLGFARTKAATRAARKASIMLKDEGIVVGDVPPKILLPWLEGASLESEEGSALEDAWAGLLVRAVKSSDAVVISYIDTLKRLGAKEAQLLALFASDTSPFFSERFFDPRYVGGLASQNLNLDSALRRLDEAADETALARIMDDFGIQMMCQVIYFSVSGGPTKATPFYRENEHAVSNLEHLGLITISHKVFSSQNFYEIYWFEISKFAFDMLWACQGVLTGFGHPGRSVLENG